MRSTPSLRALGGGIVFWALFGASLIFLGDLLAERLFLLALLPWIGWATAGVLIFGFAIFRAQRERWHSRDLLLAFSPILVVLVLAWGAGPLYRVGATSVCCEHPTDIALIERFRVHQDEFERLREMFLADPELGRVAPGFTRSASFPPGSSSAGPRISSDRLKAYRRAFESLGLDAGIEGYGDKERISFIASTRGLGVSGSAKGYVYSVKPLRPLRQSLEGRPVGGRPGIAYRHLDGEWYLYLDTN